MNVTPILNHYMSLVKAYDLKDKSKKSNVLF